MRTVRPIIFVIFLALVCAPLSASGQADEAGMVFVKGGCFTMGNNSGLENEGPAHKVCLSDFYIDVTEVTQAEYEAVTGENPSQFVNATHPVERVSWDEASAYCQKIGKRLPTEAEWEYAARGRGKRQTFPGFSSASKLDDYAWSDFDSPVPQSSDTGLKKPNSIGLYDMAGNVWEWTADWYSDSYYSVSPKLDPTGPETGTYKVARGGSWCDKHVDYFKTRYRYPRRSELKDNSIGFRCAKSAQ